MPVQSSSHFCLGSGFRPLRMSQTRTPSLVAQPMFFEGIWKVGDLSAGAEVETVGSGSRVTVTTFVWVSGGAPVTVTVSVVPPPHAAAASTSPRRRTSRPTHGSLVLHVPQLAVSPPPLLSGFRAQARILPDVEGSQLPLQLDVAVEALCLQRPVRDAGLYGAARLVEMRAVREPASTRELDDVRERRVEDAFVRPERELPHPWCVQQKRAARKRDELAVRRRVPATSALARVCGRKQLSARQTVDQRRLAHSGRAEERHRPALREIGLELVESFSGRRTDRVKRDPECDRLDLGEVVFRVSRHIALVHDDDRVRAAVPRSGQVPLQPARVQVQSERADEEDGVDVRRHHLRDGAPPRFLARECGSAREDRLDDPLFLARELANRDPVSRHGQVEPFELSGGEPAYAPVLGEKLARSVMPRGDARRDETLLFVGLERIREEGVPAEIFELQPDSFGLRNEKSARMGANGSLRVVLRKLARATGGSADAGIGHFANLLSSGTTHSAYRIARTPQGPFPPALCQLGG